jgi:hypothetical protein
MFARYAVDTMRDSVHLLRSPVAPVGCSQPTVRIDAAWSDRQALFSVSWRPAVCGWPARDSCCGSVWGVAPSFLWNARGGHLSGWKAGETYALSGWVKVENAERPAFIIAQFWSEEGKNGKMIGGATTEKACPVKGTTDWTFVSTRLTVPEGTGAVRIRAGLSSHKNPGAKAWFDDLSLVNVAAVAH